MNSLFESRVNCPYCGEGFTAFIDVSQGDHQTIEDCFVCCRPIQFLIETNGDNVTRVETFTDDDTVF